MSPNELPDTNKSQIPNVYGPGTFTDPSFIPVQDDTTRIFRQLAAETPGFTTDDALLSKVRFEGEAYPTIPGPIKAVPVAAALHGMLGLLGDEILALRGEANPDRKISINTTQVAFWLATVAAVHLDGEDAISLTKAGKLKSLIPDWERGWTDTPLKYRTTGLYPTADPNTWYSLHGSMSAEPVLRSIGIDPAAHPEVKTPEDAAKLIAQYTSKLSPEKLEFTNLLNGFCGSICFTPQQWNESSMGKSLAAHPLVDVTPKRLESQPTPPIAFPPFRNDDKRPLAGVKVVELTRVIAGPQIGTLLTSMGAEVIRINAPHLPDINIMQLTLNAGKRTIALDLRKVEDRETVQRLVKEADVFIQGFRVNKMPKYGLGMDHVLDMAAKRGRGIVYVSENCYGPDGYYAERPGWQQIADAAAGSAYVTGRSLDLPNGECVLPSLPVSDMTTGLVGGVGTLLALKQRATKGGSYAVHASLTAVNTYALRPEVGLYPKEIVAECADRFKWAEMRGQHHVLDLLVTVWDGWKRVVGGYLEEKSGWFQSFEGSAFGGKRLSILKPVVRFSDGEKSGTQPEWRAPSVPYANEDARARASCIPSMAKQEAPPKPAQVTTQSSQTWSCSQSSDPRQARPTS